MNTSSKLLHWLQQQPPLLPVALGALLGFGIGAGALFGIEGLAGAGLCMLVLGLCFFVAKDAEPVLVGVESESDPPFIEPLEMVQIAGGTFLMGSNDYSSEKPQHEVTVSDFCISRYLITRQLYRQIAESLPGQWESDVDDQQLPANHVTWFDAVKFCNALSEEVGLQACYRIEGEQVEWDIEADGYRLPTEAEWEYACRAGTTSKWFFGDDPAELGRYAWFTGNSGDRVHPVGEKEPNPFGLYDMIGNVWEWCWDWHGDYKPEMQSDPIGPKEGDARVLRGGSFRRVARFLRSANRFGNLPVSRYVSGGFRCVRRPRHQP